MFLGVVHRIDRPVSGAVIFAKTSKALARLNEMIREGRIRKIYWAVTEQTPDPASGELRHYILRDAKTNRSKALDAPRGEAREARLRYQTLAAADRYTLVGVELLTGRHHQIRAQLSQIGCPIRGDLEIRCPAVESRRRHFTPFAQRGFRAPVRREPVEVTAPVPQDDRLWAWFEQHFSRRGAGAMRVLVQRVRRAAVEVAGRERAAIGTGMLVFVGVGTEDGEEDIAWLASKIARLRIFDDDEGVMNRDLVQVGGEALVVSQFTLQASTRKGNRPSYVRAAPEPVSRPLYERFVAALAAALGRPVATGCFGADMQVSLVNDGPVTIWIDSRARGVGAAARSRVRRKKTFRLCGYILFAYLCRVKTKLAI